MNWYVLDLVLPNARRRVQAVVDRLEPVLARVRSAPRRTLVLSGLAGVLLLSALIVATRSWSGD
jgi:predicted lysophospholipase L1 biosynthesis ABC-type transport system permease subunit